MVLFFTHIPFVVNHMINAAPPERLQQHQKGLQACSFVQAAWHAINILTSRLIQAVRKKTAGSHVALRGNITTPVRVTDVVKVSKDTASLAVCIREKFFGWGTQIFCQWRHKWKIFWPTSPGPGRQPLDGSILLKFLLETRLQSESFNTLDDLLGFRVQKLWSKLIKFFD